MGKALQVGQTLQNRAASRYYKKGQELLTRGNYYKIEQYTFVTLGRIETHTEKAICDLRVELYNMMKWPSKCSDLFRKIRFAIHSPW